MLLTHPVSGKVNDFCCAFQDYVNRRTIKETPCWIEIHLHRALQLSDEVLHSFQERRQQQQTVKQE